MSSTTCFAPPARFAALALTLAACGTRTGFRDPDDAPPPRDAGGVDASAMLDGAPPPDASIRCMTRAECPPLNACIAMSCTGPGMCIPLPLSCPAIFNPICGCDGVTYQNFCVAIGRGVRFATPGRCDAVDGGARD